MISKYRVEAPSADSEAGTGTAGDERQRAGERGRMLVTRDDQRQTRA